MGDVWLPALALMLVMEGVLPFLAPTAWRETFSRMIQFNNGQVRFMGLLSMLAGLALLFLSQ
ncbi:MAG: DUF2065 domain-containing protein [Pseudomonadota bacterium]|nr:DUF2065 domain-containing protein [Pseudomonadota bacterium]